MITILKLDGSDGHSLLSIGRWGTGTLTNVQLLILSDTSFYISSQWLNPTHRLARKVFSLSKMQMLATSNMVLVYV